jgi:hypothetical protein
VSCQRQLGFYGHTSHTLWIPDGLGLSDARQAELRAAVPWWRTERELNNVALVLIVTLGVATGVATFLLRPHARPVPAALRLPMAAGTAALGLALFAATGAVLDSTVGGAFIALNPFTAFAAATMALWQWELSGKPFGGRIASAVIAGGTVAEYATVAMFIFLMQSGFTD